MDVETFARKIIYEFTWHGFCHDRPDRLEKLKKVLTVIKQYYPNVWRDLVEFYARADSKYVVAGSNKLDFSIYMIKYPKVRDKLDNTFYEKIAIHITLTNKQRARAVTIERKINRLVSEENITEKTKFSVYTAVEDRNEEFFGEKISYESVARKFAALSISDTIIVVSSITDPWELVMNKETLSGFDKEYIELLEGFIEKRKINPRCIRSDGVISLDYVAKRVIYEYMLDTLSKNFDFEKARRFVADFFDIALARDAGNAVVWFFIENPDYLDVILDKVAEDYGRYAPRIIHVFSQAAEEILMSHETADELRENFDVLCLL